MQYEDIDMPVAEARPDAITMMEEDPEFEIDMMAEANRNVSVPTRDAVVPETDFGWLIRLPETERGSASECAVPSITTPENRRASDPTLLSNADERLSFQGTNSPLGGPSSVFGSLGSLDGVGRLAQMEDMLLGGVGDEEGPTFFFDEEGNLHESQPSTARRSSVKPRTGVEYDEHDLLADVMDDHAGVARDTMRDKGKEKATDRDLHDGTDREPSLHLMDYDEEQAQAVPIYRGPMPMEDVEQEGQSAAFLVVATPRPKRKEARRLRGKYPLWDEVTELSREELIESKETILRVYERDRKEAERKARIREGKRYAENLLFEPNLPSTQPESYI
ncbi:hypothetical protein BC938DRAFT_471773 [Jimgerdemannia flammicorona]|uniref:Uncharacterized protein n=1 Tax=Jimgerdemannia flammicorona TaxID=994334 RepID=A0A433Q7F3_9FUNG|nr:hypothetical protein BC938DRAFT_471773 [Jimgerdemannia flammicorona]